jgi:hypothetical protein
MDLATFCAATSTAAAPREQALGARSVAMPSSLVVDGRSGAIPCGLPFHGAAFDPRRGRLREPGSQAGCRFHIRRRRAGATIVQRGRGLHGAMGGSEHGCGEDGQ